MAKKRSQPGSAGEKLSKVNRESRDGADPAASPAPEGAVAGGDAVKSRILWIFALILILSGFALLKKADPGGQNSWATVSPLFLLCGYLLVIPAIIVSYRTKS